MGLADDGICFWGLGIWYMLRLRGLPLRRLGQALRAIFRGGESADGISPYAALCTALCRHESARAISSAWPRALAAGGPGALLWMIAAALFGMATQYAEGYLAVRYRRRQGGEVARRAILLHRAGAGLALARP